MTTVAPPLIRLRRHDALPLSDPRLAAIARKVGDGSRLSVDDGLLLFETPDIHGVCSLADLVRRRLHGRVAYYNVNRHVNYSNVCALSCTFCSFYRKAGEAGAYEHSIERIREESLAAVEAGATEIHIVRGLHPRLPFDYYTQMLRYLTHNDSLVPFPFSDFPNPTEPGRPAYATRDEHERGATQSAA